MTYCRIYTVGTEDPDANIVVYAPVTKGGRHERTGPAPHLVHAMDGRPTYYGELEVHVSEDDR